MNKIILIVVALLILGGLFLLFQGDSNKEVMTETPTSSQEESSVQQALELPEIVPISHASFILDYGTVIVYNDPIGGAEVYVDQKPADIVLVSDTHADHFSVETLEAVVRENTTLLVPEAVADLLPPALASKAKVIINGETFRDTGNDVLIYAIPMYNTDEQGIEIRHEKGVGNGYVIESDLSRIYIAGDTANTPEMRELEDIDVAFVPMNLPYTMSIEDASAGVTAFKPTKVYPYHYRTPEGFSDVNAFKALVNQSAPEVEVVLLNWYPE